MEEIRYFNRHTGQLETEQVYGEAFLRFLYENPIGPLPLHGLVKRAAFSRWYGRRMDHPSSRSRVLPFVEKFELDPSEFAIGLGDFASFNAFFSRKLCPGARPLSPAPVVFPADGRHLGFPDISAIKAFFVKGQRFNLPALLGDRVLADRFAQGSMVLSRLCPTDYHRFHFPCAGTPGAVEVINGPLFSVSPIALRRRLRYLWENKRAITRFHSAEFGLILLLEIGATCVGSIHQTFEPGRPVEKGAEKGYFSFGGSSVITLFEPGKVSLAPDLLAHSAQQVEVYARMGSAMAEVATPGANQEDQGPA